MKKIFRILAVILALALSMSMLAACGESSGNGDNRSKLSRKKQEAFDDFDITDIDWKVESGIIDRKRRLSLVLTNSTPFTIMLFRVHYKEKAGVDEETKQYYSDHMKELMNYDENDSDDVKTLDRMTKDGLTMWTEYDGFVRSGDSIDPEPCCYFDCYRIVDDEKYINYLEPDYAVIQYLKDSKIYSVNYDFINNKFTLESDVIETGKLPTTEITQKLPKPEEGIIVASYSRETTSSFYVYDVSKEFYQKYVQSCRDIGFKEDGYSNDKWYQGKNDDKDEIDVKYDEKASRMYVNISNYN